MLFSAGSFFFFFNDTATTEIYTLSLHDALPISQLQHLNAGLGGEQVLREAPGGELVQRAFGIFSGERDESDLTVGHEIEARWNEDAVRPAGQARQDDQEHAGDEAHG